MHAYRAYILCVHAYNMLVWPASVTKVNNFYNMSHSNSIIVIDHTIRLYTNSKGRQREAQIKTIHKCMYLEII